MRYGISHLEYMTDVSKTGTVGLIILILAYLQSIVDMLAVRVGNEEAVIKREARIVILSGRL